MEKSTKSDTDDVITVRSDLSYSVVSDIPTFSSSASILTQQSEPATITTTTTRLNTTNSIWERLVRNNFASLYHLESSNNHHQSIKPFQSISAGIAVITTDLIDEVSPTPCNSPVPYPDSELLEEEGSVTDLSLTPQHDFNFYQKRGDQERVTEFIANQSKVRK